MKDLLRATLERGLAVAEQRVSSASSAVIRRLTGGVPFRSERVTTAKAARA